MRPDYCPIAKEPCQSMCESPCKSRKPLTEAQIVKCLVESGCIGKVAMSFESGPYDITRPSINADRLVRAVERAHGIVTPKEPTND